MKKLLALVLLFTSVFVFAQDNAGFDQQQMQNMMKNAQKMQQCMLNIDQSELRAFEQKGKQMQTELKALCSAGDRSAALAKVIAYSKEVASNSAIQEIKKCGEMMQGIIPDVSQITETYDSEDAEQQVCDHF